MSEYIDREKLIVDIKNRYCKPCENEGKNYKHTKCRACWVDDMIDEIEEAPTAEVIEARHGRWVSTEYPFMNECEDCSECGYRTVYGNEFKCCPNCGAKMDLAEENK